MYIADQYAMKSKQNLIFCEFCQRRYGSKQSLQVDTIKEYSDNNFHLNFIQFHVSTKHREEHSNPD